MIVSEFIEELGTMPPEVTVMLDDSQHQRVERVNLQRRNLAHPQSSLCSPSQLCPNAHSDPRALDPGE